MRLIWVMALCIGAPAFANDKPVIAPVPVWVRPVDTPALGDSMKALPLAVLLSDRQARLEPGRRTMYQALVMRLQTPESLSAANISLSWQPDTETLTIHKLMIRRGDRRIDVLAGQNFTVLRREPDLESATLDGIRTAYIQPERLQVGDVVEVASSVSSRDPALADHMEFLVRDWGVPLGRLHMRVEWPSAADVRVRTTGRFAPLKPVDGGDMRTIDYQADDVRPLVPPAGAPLRYRLGSMVEMTDFASWSEAAEALAPLYDKAAQAKAGGVLAGEIARIRRASADPKTRAEAALALVQDSIRFATTDAAGSRLAPADADTTWERRNGDGKARAALLLAVLRGLDIAADPVAVSVANGDGLDQRLPMLELFDHVLVRAVIAGRTYWLDGTRSGDTRLDRLVIPYVHWGLPLVSHGATLVRLVPPPSDTPDTALVIQIDARNGVKIPAPIHAEMTMRGDLATDMHNRIAMAPPETRDALLKAMWRQNFPSAEVKTQNASFDPGAGSYVLRMDGIATLDWRDGVYTPEGLGLGAVVDLVREPGPDRDAPYWVDYPAFHTAKTTILLPPGWNPRVIEKVDMDETIAGVAYLRRSRLAGDSFTVEASSRAVAPEFPAAEAPAAQVALRRLASGAVGLTLPSNHVPTPDELAAGIMGTPKGAGDFVSRGNMLLDLGRLDEAIADFDAALARDPKNATALADRGIGYAWKNDRSRAERDIAAAARLDPREPVVYRARALIAGQDHRYEDVIAQCTRALSLEPGNGFCLIGRAEANRIVGKDAEALADAAAAIAADRTRSGMYLLRVNIFLNTDRRDEALAETAKLLSANPDDSYAHMVAAAIYTTMEMPEEADKAYARAIAIAPDASIYIDRAGRRPKDDIAGRRADVEAALRLEPTSVEARIAAADLARDSGDVDGAIAAYSQLLDADPDRIAALAGRGFAYAAKGDAAAAERDFDGARAKAAGPDELNSLCWEKAKADVALQSALKDCEAALAYSSRLSEILDSRALVLLRLGRLDEAIADYDKLLGISPGRSSARFGRGIAYIRKADVDRGRRDIAAAVASDKSIVKRFQQYGITVPD